MFPNKSSVAYSVFLNVTGPKCAWNHLILVVSHPVLLLLLLLFIQVCTFGRQVSGLVCLQQRDRHTVREVFFVYTHYLAINQTLKEHGSLNTKTTKKVNRKQNLRGTKTSPCGTWIMPSYQNETSLNLSEINGMHRKQSSRKRECQCFFKGDTRWKGITDPIHRKGFKKNDFS